MAEDKEKDLYDRVVETIRQTQRELYIRKAKLGEPVVIGDEQGCPIVVAAEVVLARMDARAKKDNFARNGSY